MNAEIIKPDGAPSMPGSPEGNAVKASTSEKKNTTGSPFVKTGKAELSNAALRITYEAFHESHDVYIGMTDLGKLIASRLAPAAPVKEIRKEQDGSETPQKIGYACRTTSGKALKINTIHSGGDLLLPWSNLLEIVNHKRGSAPVSRIVIPDSPKPAPVRNIYAGLERGF